MYPSTHAYVVLEDRLFSTKTRLTLLMPAFFSKKFNIFGKISTFTQSNSVRTVLEVFPRRTITMKENVSFTYYASGFRIPDCSKLVKNWKSNNEVLICQHDVIVFWTCFVSLVMLSYWSQFHVNIITGSKVMLIFF